MVGCPVDGAPFPDVLLLTQDAQLASSADRGGATDRGQHVPRLLSHCDDAGRDLVTAPVTTSDTQLATSAAFSPPELRLLECGLERSRDIAHG
jgi:hypothetical protein